jgi:hypothetical protein
MFSRCDRPRRERGRLAVDSRRLAISYWMRSYLLERHEDYLRHEEQKQFTE